MGKTFALLCTREERFSPRKPWTFVFLWTSYMFPSEYSRRSFHLFTLQVRGLYIDYSVVICREVWMIASILALFIFDCYTFVVTAGSKFRLRSAQQVYELGQQGYTFSSTLSRVAKFHKIKFSIVTAASVCAYEAAKKRTFDLFILSLPQPLRDKIRFEIFNLLKAASHLKKMYLLNSVF